MSDFRVFTKDDRGGIVGAVPLNDTTLS